MNTRLEETSKMHVPKVMSRFHFYVFVVWKKEKEKNGETKQVQCRWKLSIFFLVSFHFVCLFVLFLVLQPHFNRSSFSNNAYYCALNVSSMILWECTKGMKSTLASTLKICAEPALCVDICFNLVDGYACALKQRAQVMVAFSLSLSLTLGRALWLFTWISFIEMNFCDQLDSHLKMCTFSFSLWFFFPSEWNSLKPNRSKSHLKREGKKCVM